MQSEKQIDAAARADAEYAGRTFDALSFADKTRFRERAKLMLEAALSAAEPVAWRSVGSDGVSDITDRQDIAEQWRADGIEVTPLYASPPALTAQVQDVADDPDALFWRLRVAYLRGAEWRDQTGSMELAEKASYDYADKMTSPLPEAPAKQEG